MMGRPGTGGMMGMHGGVVANKNSHVYHLPGDRGALPAPQNRIYFSSAARRRGGRLPPRWGRLPPNGPPR